MPDTIFLTDNSKSNFAENSDEVKSALNIIGNKSIKDLLYQNENLLIYSNDNIYEKEEQTIFNLYSDNSLCTTNLVGFIGVNDVKINIGSRFSDEKGKQYFIQYMLQKIHKLDLFDFKTTHDKSKIWEQLLYLIFPIFLKNAYHQGIFRVYQKKHYNDSNLKGRIEIARHIKQNLPFVGSIAYSNKELSLNNPVTQLIRHTIEFITAKGFINIFYNDYVLNNAIQLVKTITPDYNIRDRKGLILLNHKRLIHPFFTEYEPLRKICLQILNYDGLSFSNNQNKVYGILIDAAWMWEEYLNTVLIDLKFIHPENRTGRNKLHLFSNSQELYPDFYNRERSIVIDAKYKRLQVENKLNREDIYQVITYMYRLQAKSGLLLYPANNDTLESFKMNNECYEGKEALFIKYGMHIPEESSEYNEYTHCFKKSEENLYNYIENNQHQFNEQKDVLTVI